MGNPQDNSQSLDKEELAWAAGFFDGEGYTHLYKCRRCPTNRETGRLQITIAQVHREVLERFRAAVGNLGRIYGPYNHKNRVNNKPYFVFTTTKFSDAGRIINLLWPWLSSIKRNQASISIKNAENYKPNPNKRDKVSGRFISNV